MLFNFLYLDLVGYIVFLCAFIPVWVFVVLFWQFIYFCDIGELAGEDNMVELLWTVVPTMLVGCLCFLNLQCLGCDCYRGVVNVVKVVGHQWF